MHIRNALFCILPLCVLFIGCSSDEVVKKGDRFEVLVSLKEAADTQGDMEYAEGFTCNIPKGTVLQALNPSTSSGFFECYPVVLNANSDKEYILNTLVPEAVLRKPGFETFSLTLSVEYIGTKVKKLGKK